MSMSAESFAPFRSTFLSPQQVREFSRLRPSRVVFDTALSWAIILAAWTLVALRPSLLTVLIAIPIVGNRYYALFIQGHDGLHRRLFRKRWLNDLYCDALVLGPIGAITRLNNQNHLKHHQTLSTELDPDRHKYTCTNKADPIQLLSFMTGLTSVFRSAYNVFVKPAARTAAKGEGYTLRDFVILASWQAALLGGLTWFIGWWAFPVLWLLPTYVFMFLADNLRSFLEHAQIEGDAAGDQHRLITYHAVGLERCLLSPLYMNLHAAHHLWPSIPYYNLPAADRALQQAAVGTILEWRPSYLGFLWRYARALPLADCQSARPA